MSTKDWMEKDYYKTLGVAKDAKPEEIKKAFRKLARENHPDAKPGDAAAEKRFKEISEANSVLSDAKQRKEYDDQRTFGAGGFRFPRGNGTRGGGPTSMDDIFGQRGDGSADFSDLFGGLFTNATRRGGTGAGRGPRRGSDIEGEASVSFADAVKGVTVSMQMVSDAPCATCHGTGARAGSVPKVCQTCQGSGMQTSTDGGVFAISEPCQDCRGRGLVVDDPCPDCHGSGRGRSTRTMSVRIPAGVSDGQKIRLKGKGGAGENGGAAGDLYVTVHVGTDLVFGRSGTNLTVTVPVTFTEAALGAPIAVPTLGGPTVTLKLPPGTPSGRVMRVRGKGVARKDGSPGDLLVTIEVQVPTALSPEAKAALEAFDAAAPQGDPRAALLAKARERA